MPLAYTRPLPQGGATQRDTAEIAPHPGSHNDHVELKVIHRLPDYTEHARTPIQTPVGSDF
jgi:hypothetical protein